MAALHEIAVTGPEGVRQVVWRERADRRAWCEAREGAYLLRTNLTEAEAAFRALKSELAIRPIWHQKASRVQAHILVAFLGYALWVTLKHTIKRAGSAMSPQQALHGLRGIKSGDILLETTDGRTLRLRRVSRPDSRQQGLLDQLDLPLPERLGCDTECSGDSAIASQANRGVADLS